MPLQLRELTAEVIEDFIRQKVQESGADGVVVGLSGGVDSATTSKLCKEAIGADKVLNLFLPSRSTPKGDLEDARSFCEKEGMELRTVDIEPSIKAFESMLPEARRAELRGNIAARCRMIVLFHHAKLMNRLVMGTSNKSELLVGYFTKFGDGGADFCPIGDLYKTEVRLLARQLGVPKRIIDKVPSAGLWKGQTDEGELGVTYEDLDKVLAAMELNLPLEEVAKRSGVSMDLVMKVWEMHRASVHKRKMPLIPKVGLRTVGLDWRE
jgi:NAD+ synthase